MTALAAARLGDYYDEGRRENYRSWLVDTGCTHDLTTRAAVPSHQHVHISPARVPILLSTANDLMHGDTVAVQLILELGENAEPYLLDSTPDVLSIGRRCVDRGFCFE